MEDIAINICDICNLKDLSGLTLFNKNLHIAACQKKADKLNNKSVDSTPKSSHRSILSYYSSSSSAKSSQSGKSNSESETSIEEDKTSADVSPITVTSVDSSTLTPCQSKKRKIDFFGDIFVTEKYCRGYRLPIDLPISSNFPHQLVGTEYLPDLVNVNNCFHDSECYSNNLKLTTVNGETNTPCKTLEYNEKLKVK